MLVWIGRGSGRRKQQIGAVLINLVATISSIVVMLFIKDLVNGAISSTVPLGHILKLIIIIIALYIVSFVGGWGTDYYFFLLQKNWTADLQKKFFFKILNIRKNWTLGGMLSKIMIDVNEVASWGAVITPIILIQIINLSLGIYVMLRLNVHLALVAIAMLPIMYIMWVYSSFGKIEKKSKEEREEYDRSIEKLTEGAEGANTIKLYNQQNFFSNRFNYSIDRWFKKAKRLIFHRALVTDLQVLFSSIARIIVLCIGLIMMMKGMVDVGTVIALFSYAPRLYSPVRNAIDNIVTAQKLLPMWERVSAVLSEEEETSTGTRKFPACPNIEIRDVWFSYNDIPVFRGVDLDIKWREHIAIVGSSGVGKTTLAHILLRLCEPSKGCVKINSWPLGEYDLKDLRHHVLYVANDPFLVAGMSIKENIVLGDIYKPEEIQHAVEVAQVNEFTKNMDQRLGDVYVELSDGQKQRIAIARAIIRRPKILILDEATSAIDAKIEDTILQRLKTLGCTLIIISHRLATVSKADRIAVMSNGEIIDEGSHTDLYNRCSDYKELISKQIIK